MNFPAEQRYCHKEAQNAQNYPEEFLVPVVSLCGLPSRSATDTAVVDGPGKLSGQLEIIVNDIFEVNARCSSVGKESHQRGFAFVLFVFGDTPIVHRLAEAQALQHLCLRQA